MIFSERVSVDCESRGGARAGSAPVQVSRFADGDAPEQQGNSHRQETQESNWQITLGAGVASMPEHPGDGDTGEVQALPVVNIRYGRFFLGGVPGGGGPGRRHWRVPVWRTSRGASGQSCPATSAARERNRTTQRLRGSVTSDATVRAGVFANYRLASWLWLRASAHSDIAGNDQGTLADASDMEADLSATSPARLFSRPRSDVGQ